MRGAARHVCPGPSSRQAGSGGARGRRGRLSGNIGARDSWGRGHGDVIEMRTGRRPPRRCTTEGKRTAGASFLRCLTAPTQRHAPHGLSEQPERRQVLGCASRHEPGPAALPPELQSQGLERQPGHALQEVELRPQEIGTDCHQVDARRSGADHGLHALVRPGVGPGEERRRL